MYTGVVLRYGEIDECTVLLHGWGVGDRWWQPYLSLVIPHIWVRRRAIGSDRLVDQVRSSARIKQVEVEFTYD